MLQFKRFSTITVLTLGIPTLLFAQVKKTDTTFIQRNALKGTTQSIYFDNNRSSYAYNEISDFTFSAFDKDVYQSSLNYLKENNLALSKQKTILPWTKWVTLQQYKGKFYAYKPCDFYVHHKVSINDSSFVDWTGEGPQANKIISQNKTGDKTFEMDITDIAGQHRKLIIHIIDNKKGIAVFEEKNTADNKSYYYLMIAAEKIRNVPLIVNNCTFNKQSELEFEQPDFERLVK